MRLILGLALVLAVVGCSGAAPADPPAAVFEGLPLRGTTQTARDAGFRDCSSKYSGRATYSCSRVVPTTLLGVGVRAATVQLLSPGGADTVAGEPAPLDKLAFAGVALELGATPFDAQCVDKNGQLRVAPIECRKADSGIEYMHHHLQQAGWVKVSGKQGWSSYMHPSSPAQITLSYSDNSATLVQVAQAYRDQVLVERRAVAQQPAAQR